jgi:hypothetical protein
MRRIDRLHLQALALQLARGEPRIGAALGAVTMQHISPKLCRNTPNLGGCAPIAEADLPAHGNSGEAERTIVRQAAERHGIAFGAGIADHSDLGAKLGLAKREVVDVAEQASDGCAQAMQNAKRGAHWTRIKEKNGSVSFRRSVRARK